jgi:hypothetical protein
MYIYIQEALEKQTQLLKEEAHMAHRITGVLDPYTETLAQFNGTNDLSAKISSGTYPPPHITYMYPPPHKSMT